MAPPLEVPARAPDQRWSLQLHAHGSMSEGNASWELHSEQADKHSVDVLWWSDHDWFISEYQVIDRFGFEGGVGEPMEASAPHLSGAWQAALVSQVADDSGCEVSLDERKVEGKHSARVALESDKRNARCVVRVRGEGRRSHRAAAAEPRYELSVLPEAGSWEDTHLRVEFQLSAHPPQPTGSSVLGGTAPRAGYYLQYVYPPEAIVLPLEYVPGKGGARIIHRRPLDLKAGEWNTVTIDLLADIGDGFPWLADPMDNAVFSPVMGVFGRGEPGAALFDDYRISSKYRHQALFDHAKGMAERLEERVEVSEFVGVEVSLCGPHLNVFLPSGDPGYDYDLLEYSKASKDCWGDVVSQVHARGGLISLNHPFGIDRTTTAETSNGKKGKGKAAGRYRANLTELRAANFYDADLLEVGYVARGGLALSGHLKLWDTLFLDDDRMMTGVGVSDHHDDALWAEVRNNFVTWAEAPSSSREEVVEALRAGRATFGPVTSTGALATSAAGFPMGSAVLTDQDEATLSFTVEGAPEDSVAIVVEYSGGEESRTRFPLKGPDAQTIEHGVDTREDALVRVEVWSGIARLSELVSKDMGRDIGEPVVFGNPIAFYRAVPKAGLPRGRAGVALGPLALRESEGVSVEAASWEAGTLSVAGRGHTLSLPDADRLGRFDVSPVSASAKVQLQAGEGAHWRIVDDTLFVWDISGPFKLTVTP